MAENVSTTHLERTLAKPRETVRHEYKLFGCLHCENNIVVITLVEIPRITFIGLLIDSFAIVVYVMFPQR